MRRLIIVLFAFLAFRAYSQDVDTNKAVDPDKAVDLKGTVYDRNSKSPVKAALTFRDADGSEYMTESHEVTGMYQLFLPFKETYIVKISSPTLLQREEKISLLPVAEAPRQRIDFYASRLFAGMTIDSFTVFREESPDFNKTGEYVLDYYIELFKVNPGVKFVFIIVCSDISTNADSLLSQSRVESLVKYMEKWKDNDIFRRIEVTCEPHQYNPPSGTSQKKPDLFIIVREISLVPEK